MTFHRNAVRTHLRRAALLLAVSALPSCVSHVPKDLADARSAYRAAADGPAAEHSPEQLESAHQALRRAERTYQDEGDSFRTRDQAYVAQRRAQLADTLARIAESDAKLAALAQKMETAEASQLAETKSELDVETARRQQAEQAAAQAQQTAQQAAAALSRIAAVKQEERGLVITLSGSVLFTSDKAELLPDAEQRLGEVARALTQGSPDAQIIVEGHTDAKGSQGYNLELSARRAEAVRNYLIAHGVAPERIRAQGLGFTRPVSDNRSAEGRANNRRVEIVVQ